MAIYYPCFFFKNCFTSHTQRYNFVQQMILSLHDYKITARARQGVRKVLVWSSCADNNVPTDTPKTNACQLKVVPMRLLQCFDFNFVQDDWVNKAGPTTLLWDTLCLTPCLTRLEVSMGNFYVPLQSFLVQNFILILNLKN